MQAHANRYIDEENEHLEQVFLRQQARNNKQKTATVPTHHVSAFASFLSTNSTRASSSSVSVSSHATSAGNQVRNDYQHQAAPSQRQGHANLQPHPQASHPQLEYGTSSQSTGVHSSGQPGHPSWTTQPQPLPIDVPNTEAHSTPALPQQALNQRATAHYTENGLSLIRDFENAVPTMYQPDVFAALAAACTRVSSSATDHLRLTSRATFPQLHPQTQRTPMTEGRLGGLPQLRHHPYHPSPPPAARNRANLQPANASLPAYTERGETPPQFPLWPMTPTPPTIHNQLQPPSPMPGARDSPLPLHIPPLSPVPLPHPFDLYNDEAAQNNVRSLQDGQLGYMSAGVSSSEKKSATCHLCKSTQKLARCSNGQEKKRDRTDSVAPPCQTQHLASCCPRICDLPAHDSLSAAV